MEIEQGKGRREKEGARKEERNEEMSAKKGKIHLSLMDEMFELKTINSKIYLGSKAATRKTQYLLVKVWRGAIFQMLFRLAFSVDAYK